MKTITSIMFLPLIASSIVGVGQAQAAMNNTNPILRQTETSTVINSVEEDSTLSSVSDETLVSSYYGYYGYPYASPVDSHQRYINSIYGY